MRPTACAGAWRSQHAITSRQGTSHRPTPPRPPKGHCSGLVDRLFDSFNLPFGPARYLELMSPALPDGETIWSRLNVAPHGRSWQIANEEWPKIRDDIDSGHPSPLGVVEVKSTNPFDLKENHQVLAFGYDLVGSSLTLNVYDPNIPGRDDVGLSLSLADPRHPAPITTFPPGARYTPCSGSPTIRPHHRSDCRHFSPLLGWCISSMAATVKFG
jgi:hypothetical protein